MKSLFSALLAGLLLVGRAPSAEIVVDPEVLNPKSTIELRFEVPMIPKDRVGTVDPECPLVFKPALQGEFRWTSSRSGQFLLTKPPQLSTKYKVELREGMKDAEGKPVDVEEFGALESEKFDAVADGGGLGRHGLGSDQRVGRLLVQFSDAVDMAGVSGFYFQSGDGAEKFPVTVRAAVGQDFSNYHNPDQRWRDLEALPTWGERFAGIIPELKPKEARPNALVVETKQPLPVGNNWALHIPAAFANASHTAHLEGDLVIPWGSVEQLAVGETRADTHFDRAHEVTVYFNKVLASDEDEKKRAALFVPFVKVNPPVPNLTIEPSWQSLGISGDFELNKEYTITVADGLPGADGLNLETPATETVTFHPSAAYISTSAHESSQMSGGKGIFDIFAANFKNLHVRVKQLDDSDLIKARELYASNYYTNEGRWDGATGDKGSALKSDVTKFDEFPGKLVFDKTFANEKPLEKGTVYNLNWHDLLGQTPAAPAFVEIEGEAQDGAPGSVVLNRAIVEFTDLGLVVKTTGRETLVHAFSLKTGLPVPNVQVSALADSDPKVVASGSTDADGIVTLSGEDVAWVLAKNGTDCTASRCGGDRGNSISLWRAGVNIGWQSPWESTRQTFIFSDRPVYKPGDTAHVKAYTRIHVGDELHLDGKAIPAHLTVTDPHNHTILTKDVTISANGSWSGDITFPDGATGWYQMNLKFGGSKEDDPTGGGNDAASLALRVDDYKPNTFEIKLDGDNFKVGHDRITVPLTANYYMGKALSKAKVTWNASTQQDFTPPDDFAAYSFGDVDAYWHYGENRDEETATDQPPAKEWGAHGDLALAEDGSASIVLPPPPPHKAALPQTVAVSVDVTDVNQQTISAATSFLLPGAEFIIGVKHDDWYGFIGKQLKCDLVAITPDGKPFSENVPVDIKVERQDWITVREEAAGGAVTTKNEVKLVEEEHSTAMIEGTKDAAPKITNFSYMPKKSGTYFMTVSGKSAAGLTVFTRVPFYVIGGDGFPWAWEDGAQITLQPDKTSVAPGGEVSIVVKSPFSGKALVTVERNRIQRHFLADITQENPVIKVPIKDEDAPNVFISVVVIRGAANSPQPNPMPDYRIGYCEIKVPTDINTLAVELKPSKDTVKPGEELTVTGQIKDSTGKPVQGSDVTLYAVDEGVLSLMAYQTPDVEGVFHMDSALWVKSYTTLTDLLSEDLDKRYRGNKGVLIGGGGDDAGADDALRKNFVATALWIASATSDASGNVSATFKVPDSLTRYRIMAVAAKDAGKFGKGESAFVVNKPLMIDPVVPRFAHLGDEILVKAVLHNTTKISGQVEVELKLDHTADLITEQRPYVPVALTRNRTFTNDGKTERRIVDLKAGETTALAFPVRFVDAGTTGWQWRVRTTQWEGAALGDAVESAFEVTRPAPSLREVHYSSLTSATSKDDLLKKVNPQLLESDGTVRLDASRSRLGEARDALEHILHYPYGCVEQSTSNMLPWITLSKYEPLFPDLLQKDKVHQAIQRGADRILRMQTDEGGLAYWPGSTKPLLWATAYGGFGLLKAKESGINVPQDSLDKLTKWMAEELPKLNLNTTDKTWDLCDASLALYTLARFGKPEPSYQTILYQRRDRLPEVSRLFLSMAMSITKSPEKLVKELLPPPPANNPWEHYWLGGNTANGLRLLMCAQLGLTAEGERITNELFEARNSEGHWGTTFSNAWVLMALAANEHSTTTAPPVTFAIGWGDKKTSFTVGGVNEITSLFDFGHEHGASKLTVEMPPAATLHGRVEVKAWPDFKTFQPVEKGFAIHRTYKRLTPTGELEEAKDLRVGDLIVVKLSIEALKGNRFIAIEDPLPSVFEPINPEFGTQNQREDAKAKESDWTCDYRELRNDKALFFTDEWSRIGKFDLSYLARVIAEGDVIVPPTRIEAMYDPNHYGLGEIQRVQTLPMTNGANVVDK